MNFAHSLPLTAAAFLMHAAMQEQMGAAVARLETLGGQQAADFDFAPFAETAVLLYGAPFVAERYAGESQKLEWGWEWAKGLALSHRFY